MGKSDPLKVFSRKGGKEGKSSSATRSHNSRSSADNRSSTGNYGGNINNPMATLSDLDFGDEDEEDFDWGTLPSSTSYRQSLQDDAIGEESLPSFRRLGGRSSNDAIERDAVDTIRDTSGAYEEPDSASDNENAEMNDEYERKRERLVGAEEEENASETSSQTKAPREGKNVRFHPETDNNVGGEDHPIAPEETDTQAGPGDDVENDDNSSTGTKDAINVQDEEGSETSSSNNENKLDHFKKFFRRGSVQSKPDGGQDGGEKGMRNMKDDEEDEEKEGGGGFLSKMLQNIKEANNGLAPGLRDVNLHPARDPENNTIQEADMENGGIPLVDFNSVAQGIVKNYSSLPHAAGPQDEQASYGGENIPSHISSSPGSTGFIAPPVDNYDFDQVESDGEDSDLDPFVGAHTYVPPPQRVRGGVLGSLLKMYQNEDLSDSYSTASSLPEEASSQPGRPLLGEHPSRSRIPTASSLLHVPSSAASHFKKNAQHLAGGAHNLATKHYPGKKKGDGKKNLQASESDSELPSFKNVRPKKKHKKHLPKFKKKMAAEAKITVHIADILQRHRFVLRMCKGLMMYGAPTHRLEEYMIMTSRVLEIDGQFLYLPGCMIVSFGDATTRTSEVQLVRCAQGVNLWKLHQVHSIYKQVVHDTMSASEGNILMDKVLQDRNLIPSWVCVLLYGFCSAMVTPYAFGGDWINLAVSFFIGTCVGALQFIVSTRSNMYSNVFEISASIVVSFVGRAFGSIGKSKICFGAVTQGSLALILPGYIILCGALELQSRNLVAGSVRMFYAIIYSLFLSFGITLGAALFGWMYKNATNETSCPYPISAWYRFLFVPAFTIGISLINQAHWIQLPVMVVISCVGYIVTYYSGKHFKNSTEFTASLAAFVIGIMGNLYSRIWKGLAVSAMLPAIFVQVPSGVASQSSLLSGLQSANMIIQSANNSKETTTTTAGASDLSGSLSFGVTMIQVSIGITVGLFGSSLIVYPFGKKSTGLFSL